MASDVRFRTCPLCEAMCGLALTVEDERVTLVRGDRDDVFSRGYLCPKGSVLGRLHDDPDRLRAPVVRDGDGWREVSWDEALALVAERLLAIRAEHGNDAIGVYIGNPTAHNLALGTYVPLLIPLTGSRNVYSAGTVDQWPKNVVCALMYGGMWTIPVPDLDRTQHLIVLGGNPAASNGSLMAAPDVMGRIDAIRARGGKVVVVDPRRTGTAQHADEWVPIRPGTDAYLLAAMAHVIDAEGLAAPGALAEHVDGWDDVLAVVRRFPPEAVAARCGIDVATIRRMARELAAAPSAAVYGRIGLCTQEFGTLASWLVEVLNLMTGNLDRPGGMMWTTPLAIPLTSIRPPGGYTFHTWSSRVRGTPEVLGQVPVSCLAEEIATPGEGQVRALITIAGNPVLSAPDAGRLEDALPGLDFMVSIDNYVNETTRHADVILPGESPLQLPHYDALIGLWTIRNVGRWSEPVFAPDEDRPREWEVLLTIGAALAAGEHPVDLAMWDDLLFSGVCGVFTEDPRSPVHGRDPAELVAATSGLTGPERFLDLGIRVSPHGDHFGARPGGLTLAEVKRHAKGIDRGPLEPRVPDILTTDDGRIHAAPPYVLADVDRLAARLEEPAGDELLLIGRRHLRSNNSWLHNLEPLVKGKDRCTLLVHPDDAMRRGLVDGGSAKVVSSAGEVVAPVEVSDEMMPGVVSLPHGWGHDLPGVRLGVARRYAGVNANVLAPGELVDVPSATQITNGIPVQVAPA